VSDRSFDFQAMLQRAQELGARIQSIEAELRRRTVEASVGGGMVTVVANGAMEIVSVRIDPQAVDPRDVEMLQSLIASATNEALRRARALAQEELARATGLPLGGLLPGIGA
jgi:DNA-binding YbaB/EbfC family protein